MSNRVRTSQQSSNTSRNTFNITSNVGIVVDVILTKDHDRIQKTDSEFFSTGKDTSIVGNCVIRPLHDAISAEADLFDYPPYDSLNVDIPLIGETVELIKVGNVQYYRRITKGTLNLGNAKENFNKDVFELTEPKQNTAAEYSTTSQTQTTGTTGESDRDTILGKKFEETQINKLKLYEADKIIQSRFGQSIRFSAYNNADGLFAPTVIIRNRQNDVSLDELEVGDLVEEDINRDGSILIMTTKDHLLDFQPGTVDDGGSTDFETKPDNFKDFPSKFDDVDTTLLSSGRIIFSSKNAEMLFYSKSNYGFISDGHFSIDNGKGGATLNFNDDVRITTNDNDTFILGGKGSIYLNTEEDKEPLARGQTLVDILKEILEEIVAQVYATPSGPTATGPTNAAKFNKIKAKLNDIKSTLNYTE